MFPAMLVGPSLSGILFRRRDGANPSLAWVRPPARWYAALLIPPVLVLTVLSGLRFQISPVYAPNWFPVGVLFGIPAGLLEEIGWTGYAFPRMLGRRNALGPAVLLGALWSLWHLPAIDYLGAATPHGDSRLAFSLAFAVAMTAMRVLIGWVFLNTNSVWMAQAMHVVSTASLVVFGAARVSARQEAIWYGVYGASLWLVVAVVAAVYGKRLKRGAVA